MKIQTKWNENYKVGIPEWKPGDGLSRMIEYELLELGQNPVKFPYDNPLPDCIDILLTYAPYNKILPIWEKVAKIDRLRRPIVVHWNTEGLPDLRIPIPIIRVIANIRSKLGRLSHSKYKVSHFILNTPLYRWIDKKLIRFRLFGDYEYAYKKGWLNILFDTSKIYCAIRSKAGIPTWYAPWGASQTNFADLNIKRDIDVLWMGDRATKRRNDVLNFINQELTNQGYKIHIADNKVNPFIFDDERTVFLNRSKITLNLTRTWYDDNYSRFSFAAPNRSMIISEPLLLHCPEIEEGIHFISAKIENLPKTIIYYLEHESEMQQIAENAYNLFMTKLLFSNSIRRMLEAADEYKIVHGGNT